MREKNPSEHRVSRGTVWGKVCARMRFSSLYSEISVLDRILSKITNSLYDLWSIRVFVYTKIKYFPSHTFHSIEIHLHFYMEFNLPTENISIISCQMSRKYVGKSKCVDSLIFPFPRRLKIWIMIPLRQRTNLLLLSWTLNYCKKGRKREEGREALSIFFTILYRLPL